METGATVVPKCTSCGGVVVAFMDYMWLFRLIKLIAEALLGFDPKEAEDRGLIQKKES